MSTLSMSSDPWDQERSSLLLPPVVDSVDLSSANANASLPQANVHVVDQNM